MLSATGLQGNGTGHAAKSCCGALPLPPLAPSRYEASVERYGAAQTQSGGRAWRRGPPCRQVWRLPPPSTPNYLQFLFGLSQVASQARCAVPGRGVGPASGRVCGRCLETRPGLRLVADWHCRYHYFIDRSSRSGQLRLSVGFVQPRRERGGPAHHLATSVQLYSVPFTGSGSLRTALAGGLGMTHC